MCGTGRIPLRVIHRVGIHRHVQQFISCGASTQANSQCIGISTGRYTRRRGAGYGGRSTANSQCKVTGLQCPTATTGIVHCFIKCHGCSTVISSKSYRRNPGHRRRRKCRCINGSDICSCRRCSRTGMGAPHSQDITIMVDLNHIIIPRIIWIMFVTCYLGDRRSIIRDGKRFQKSIISISSISQ